MDAPVIERRATAGITASGRVLSGYAAVYGVDTKIGGFTERIAPGAFKETLAKRAVMWPHWRSVATWAA